MNLDKALTQNNEIGQLSKFASLLRHPVRVYILKKLLAEDSCCYSGEIHKEIKVSRSTLSQHFKKLKNAGLIDAKTEATYIKYMLNRDTWSKMKTCYNKCFGIV